MDKLKLGIIFGGVSEEHPVSVKSVREVAKSLDLDKYDPKKTKIPAKKKDE